MTPLNTKWTVLGPEVQSVVSPTADPGVGSLTPAWSDTFLEIGHEIVSTVILLPLIQEGLLSVTSESMCQTKVLVNCLVKLTQEKSVVR